MYKIDEAYKAVEKEKKNYYIRIKLTIQRWANLCYVQQKKTIEQRLIITFFVSIN